MTRILPSILIKVRRATPPRPSRLRRGCRCSSSLGRTLLSGVCVWALNDYVEEVKLRITMVPDSVKTAKPGRWGLAVRIARSMVILYVVVTLLLMLFEEFLIFPASRYPAGEWNPSVEFEDIWLESEDETALHGWYFDHPDPRGYLLYCHGNGGNVTNRAHVGELLRTRYQLGVFIFDYRGYGRSDGRAHEAGILADARAAQAWLASRAGVQKSELIILGRSIGGAVAVDLASASGAKALILESTFNRLPDVAARHYWFLPVRRFMRTRLDSASKIANYKGPLLQNHGAADEIVPFELGKVLFDAANAPKQFVEMNDVSHNGPWPEAYYQEMEKFLGEILDDAL